ncbi:bifunctional 2-polyprenyl-6-hydroxyphenol methylase/3-demethylubiquinol 3-O-methyltransferase UbiG [Alcanivorax sp. 1008]|uniref:class I SAM-dependent methyltransferase n=1 Tax=Alcanivorax sp. 1008 TaxID=2816853 RepID=UPI001D410ED0|nr:methyltransferase domain-containing protein [Alcanivorax sp. 1008]MCC1496957.1 methyltransferase domain-containing protein [Alcanivorax sp. 1008]
MSDQEQQILHSWEVNAAPWTQVVRNQEIASRKLVTDAAIIEAIKIRCPATVLDIGCGEGWLARRLADQGMQVTGVDAIPALIGTARAAGGADYYQLSYQQLVAGELRQRFDVLVCNFSLLGETSVENLLAGLPAMLSPGGSLLIQTLHPTSACGDQPYQDGWREGSWQGFSDAFSRPAPWYFRTLEGWLALFAHTGWQCEQQIEPAYQDGRIASVIFVLAPS